MAWSLFQFLDLLLSDVMSHISISLSWCRVTHLLAHKQSCGIPSPGRISKETHPESNRKDGSTFASGAPVVCLFYGARLVSLTIARPWFCSFPGNIGHCLFQPLLNGPGRLVQGCVLKDCVPGHCEVLHHRIKGLTSGVRYDVNSQAIRFLLSGRNLVYWFLCNQVDWILFVLSPSFVPHGDIV